LSKVEKLEENGDNTDEIMRIRRNRSKFGLGAGVFRNSKNDSCRLTDEFTDSGGNHVEPKKTNFR
jgi:hypothetical protein